MNGVPVANVHWLQKLERNYFVVVTLSELKCITLTDDFNELILNKKVLHLVSYSVNKNGCIKEKETEKFNKMLRYTGQGISPSWT